jgi:hypothetical protein
LRAAASKPMDIDDLSGITSKVEELVSPRLRGINNQLKAIFEKKSGAIVDMKSPIWVSHMFKSFSD